MSFRFNFPNPEEDNGDDDEEGVQSPNSDSDSLHKKDCSPVTREEDEAVALEVKIGKNHQMSNEIGTVSYDIADELIIKSLDTKQIEDKLKKDFDREKNDSVIREALVSNNDLIPDKYEGGLQIWECGIDLAKFISTKDFTSKIVAELGCGGALPGLCALKKGAKYVLFQDFNAEVLSNLTIPNVLLNCEEKKTQCAFFSGDWKNLPGALEKSENVAQKYNVILTAETIYNSKNYSKLLDLLDFLLDADGEIYVAAKAYYFGVGGSTREFMMKVLDDKRFICKYCWSQNEGVCREILRLHRKRK